MTATMSIPDFVRYGWQEDRVIDKVIAHCRRHKIKYEMAGFTLILFLGMADISQAHEAVAAFAQGVSSIDSKAYQIYRKIITVGKWVIICKGAMETIKSAADGDFDTAKRRFLGYMVVYGLLWALPWGMDQVEGLFEDLNKTAATTP